MAVNFDDERETSTGPLDVSKSAGSDDSPADGIIKGSDEALDGSTGTTDPTTNSADADEVEILRQKNPLGYTITPPTEDEIERGKP